MAQNLKVKRLQGQFTRPADTTAYTAQDGVSNSTSAGTILTLSAVNPDWTTGLSLSLGGSYQVKNVKLTTNSKTTTNASFDVYLFSSGVTACNDNAEYGLDFNEKHVRIGKSSLTLLTAGGTNSTCKELVNTDVDLTFTALTGNLYAQIVATAAYTPASGEIFFLQVEVVRIDD